MRDIRSLYDGMLDGAIPCPATDRKLGGLTRQIMMPHQHHPGFASNPVLDRARALAKHLLHVDEPEFVFSMLIYKPPHHKHETPWHQDLAYAATPFAPAGTRLETASVAQFWLALEDVDETMGCMEFAPGRERETLFAHHIFSGAPDDDGRLLAIDCPARDLDIARAVKCPLPAGSATVHAYTTPHYTGPNRSDRGRRAYIFSFADPVKLARARAELRQAT